MSDEVPDPGYDIAPPKVWDRRIAQGKKAPMLMVLYGCPAEGCEGVDTRDAYRGPPECRGMTNKPHRGMWMVALGIEREVL